jgi:Cof subfamily protein (haloacid dehalogenase superfamily)
MNIPTTYKAAAFDLDGTLLRSDKSLSELTLRTIAQLQEQGMLVIIATGRSRESLEPFRSRLDIHTPIICYSGACVMEADTGEEHVHLTMPEPVCRDIVKLSREFHLPLHAYSNHKLYYEPMSVRARSYEVLSRNSSVMVDFDSITSLTFTKAMYIGDVPTIELIRSRLEESYPGALSKVYTYLDYFEIMQARADKRYALEHVLSRFGIRREETLAFGDGENDLEMLAWAGHGVTMANAPQEVLRHARFIAPHNDEDGVARYLRELLDL